MLDVRGGKEVDDGNQLAPIFTSLFQTGHIHEDSCVEALQGVLKPLVPAKSQQRTGPISDGKVIPEAKKNGYCGQN